MPSEPIAVILRGFCSDCNTITYENRKWGFNSKYISITIFLCRYLEPLYRIVESKGNNNQDTVDHLIVYTLEEYVPRRRPVYRDTENPFSGNDNSREIIFREAIAQSGTDRFERGDFVSHVGAAQVKEQRRHVSDLADPFFHVRAFFLSLRKNRFRSTRPLFVFIPTESPKALVIGVVNVHVLSDREES